MQARVHNFTRFNKIRQYIYSDSKLEGSDVIHRLESSLSVLNVDFLSGLVALNVNWLYSTTLYVCYLVLGAGLGGRLCWLGPMYFSGEYFGFSITSRPK